jgi:hypothetical protein
MEQRKKVVARVREAAIAEDASSRQRCGWAKQPQMKGR